MRAMGEIAPLELAAGWDNVGLLLGASDDPLLGPVMLTIDMTGAVVDEAIAAGASAVVAYHPPIFQPLKRLTDQNPGERGLLRAARARLAVYSPHTALDAAPGAMGDWLADQLLGGTAGTSADRRALTPAVEERSTEQVKIVTFVPKDKLETIRHALATAGAGRIGHYQVCSFAIDGTGTFLGDEGASPAVGRAGQLEHVSESRLEMVCSREGLALAVATLRQFHPYEEPAVDVYALVPKPARAIGAGRRLTLDRPVTVAALAERLKSGLQVPRVQVAMADEHPVTTIGVVPGAGADLAPVARAAGCEVFVTGEMKHHEVLAAVRSGLTVMLAGHTNTERGYLPSLAERLGGMLPGVRFIRSGVDRDPLKAV